MNRLFPLILLITLPILANAQLTEKDVFTSTSLVWCGLDYSNMRCYGKKVANQFKDEEKIKTFYPKGWNELVIKEQSKYDIAHFFRKETVIYDPRPAIESSKSLAAAGDDFISLKKYSLAEEKVRELVKQYEMEQKSGIGLVYVIETLHYPSDYATMYVTFFDIATRDVLFIQKTYGGAGGLSFRNYWLSPILNVHRYCRSSWKKWKKAAMK